MILNVSRSPLFLSLLFASLLLGVVAAAHAEGGQRRPCQRGTHSPTINQRQHHQQERIQQGIRSGELTQREAARLQRQQAHLNRMESRFKADGELTAAERAKLRRQAERYSDNIYRQKHDNQERPD